MSTTASDTKKSTLVQKIVSDTSNTGVQTSFDSRGDGTEIPIVLVPNDQSCFCMLEVPGSGHVIFEKFLQMQDGDLYPPGTQFCVPGYNRIAYIVQSGTITYNYPAKNVPTLDHIMVDFHVVVSFMIKDFEDARTFVYELGASSLDALLSATLEESVRNLVHRVKHNDVEALSKSSNCSVIQEKLKNKLLRYGITVVKVKIPDINLPPDLQQRFQRTLLLENEIQELQDRQNGHKHNTSVQSSVQQADIEAEYALKCQKCESDLARYTIELEGEKASIEGERDVKITTAISEQALKKAECESEEQIAKTKGEQYRAKIMMEASRKTETERLTKFQEADTLIANAKARFEVAKANADAIIEAARAEERAADQLKEKRKYDLEWARLEILATMAASGRRLISGERADKLMNDLIPTNEMKR